jgi:glucose/arabinose dehydrogenase
MLKNKLIVLAFLLASVSAINAATLPPGFTETATTGLNNPTAMEIAPDGRIFVCQQGGSLRVIKNGVLLSTPFLTLNVDQNGERGLLGIALDPNFAAIIFSTSTTPFPPHHDTTASVASLRTATSSCRVANKSFSSSTT